MSPACWSSRKTLRGIEVRPETRPRHLGARWSECARAADSGSPRNPWVSWGGEHRSTRISNAYARSADPGSPRNRRFRGVGDGPGKGAPTQWGYNGPHPVDRRSRPADPSSTASSELALSGGASQRDLAGEFRAGKVRGLARAITLVEQRDPSVRHLLESLGELGRLPYVVGLTGAPGTG